MTTHIRILQKK